MEFNILNRSSPDGLTVVLEVPGIDASNIASPVIMSSPASTPTPVPAEVQRGPHKKIIGGKGKRKLRVDDQADALGQAVLQLVLEKKKKLAETEDDKDGDESFLKSCLAQLKKLPAKQRLEAKMEIMNVLYFKLFTSPTE